MHHIVLEQEGHKNKNKWNKNKKEKIMNWNEICTKYNSYWINNDIVGMNFLLNHVISLGYANNVSGAFAQLKRRCGEYGWNINEWTHPSQTNAQIDCYKCDEQIMNRIPASQSCPKSWLSSPVNPSTLQSANPCNPQAKVTQNGGFNNGGGRVQAGIKRPDYYNAPTTNFDALGQDKSDIPAPMTTNPQDEWTIRREGNDVIKERKMPNGITIRGIIYNGGKETGCHRKSCKYKINIPGLFNDIKVEANCQGTKDNCMCFALEC